MSAIVGTTQPFKIGVGSVACGSITSGECLLHALEREVLGLAREQRLICSDQRVDRKQTRVRRTIQEDHVEPVVKPRSAFRSVSSRPILPAGANLPPLGGAYRFDRITFRHRPKGESRRRPSPHRGSVTDCGVRVGIYVEVVRQVPLRVKSTAGTESPAREKHSAG